MRQNDRDEEIVLRGLSRPGLASHPLTQEYLEAGRDLVVQALEAGASSGEAHPFFKWLSRPAVISAVDARGTFRGNAGTFRDRWLRHADYIGDVVEWIRHKRNENRFPVRADQLAAAVRDGKARPTTLVRALTQDNLANLFGTPLFRFQLLVSAVAGASPAGAEGVDRAGDLTGTEFYREVEASWQPVVEAFLQAHELSFRPGLELADLMAILIAVAEGLALRELVEPTTGDARKRRETLQGLTALALLLTCTGTDGRTVDDVLDAYLAVETRNASAETP